MLAQIEEPGDMPTCGQSSHGQTPQVYGIIDPDYARVYTVARCIAWQEGYSCTANGSFTRDLDLLIVPWTKQARPDAEIVVRRVASAAKLCAVGEPGAKPHGRISWTFVFENHEDPRFIDISIFSAVPPATEAASLAEETRLVLKELVDLKPPEERIETADLATYGMEDAATAQRLQDEYTQRRELAWRKAKEVLLR